MATTVTLAPVRASGFSDWQGSTTPEAAVADSSATSWVAFRRGVPCLFEFGPIVGVPGPTVVSSVTVNLTIVALDDLTREWFVGWLLTSPTLLASGGGRAVATLNGHADEDNPQTAGSTTSWSRTASWSPLTVDTCSHLVLRVWGDGAAADSVAVAKAELSIVYDTALSKTAPTVTVSAPTGALLATGTAPVVTWSSSTTQRAWQVRVFDSATYGGGGFDASTSTAAWESGPNGGDQLGVTIPEALDTSTAFRAYVRSHDGYQWSSWAYSGWTYAAGPTVATDAVSSASGHGFDATWVVTAGDTGARQVAAEVRIFDATPSDADDAAQYASGVLWQSAPFHTVDEWIEDTGTNEVWVRVMDADGQWSDWNSDTLTLTPSATSTPGGATASWDASNGRVTIVLPVCTNAGTGQLRRSVDAGATWTALTSVATSNSTTTTTYDYRAPLNASVRYDWRQLDGTTNGAGAWTTVATVSVPAGVSWVKHPTSPTLNVSARVLDGGQQSDSDLSAVLEATGRSVGLVQSDSARGPDAVTVELHASTWATAKALDVLFRAGVPLLVQRADGRQWWLAVEQQTVRSADGRGTHWLVTWQGTEVEEP